MSQETRPNYLGVLARPLIVVAALAVLLAWNTRRGGEPATEKPVVVAPKVENAADAAVETVEVRAEPVRLTSGLVEIALGEVEAARRARAAAEAAVASTTERTTATLAERTATETRIRDLETEAAILIERARRAEAERAGIEGTLRGLQAEVATLASAPKPKAKPLIDRNPVARPPGGEEFHFEVRGDRVAFINVNGLLDLLKVDARIQLRMLTMPKPISGKVGPVGWFSMRYDMVPAGLELGSDGYGGRGGVQASYSLNRWEVVPTQSLRGETLAEALSPASDFGRAINSLDPRQDTITIWVYPDGFAMFRQVRDHLHERGFLVAARPLPADMPIRGSPSGSLSAGQ